jgi:hypothetical protein
MGLEKNREGEREDDSIDCNSSRVGISLQKFNCGCK